MGLFSKNKELKRAREEQQRLQLELDIARETRKERQRGEDMLRYEKLLLEQQMNEARRQEEERLAREAEAKRLKEQKLAREAEDRKKEEDRIRLEQQEYERKLRDASPEKLRSFRELIRRRYELDCEIWDLRNARRPDRWIVEQKMVQSDDIMDDIMAMLEAWGDNNDGRWTADEFERVKDIRRRLEGDGKRVWNRNPPWNERGEMRV